MLTTVVAFVLSWITALVVLRLARTRGIGLDDDLGSQRRFHVAAVPRLGGLCVGLGLVAAAVAAYFKDLLTVPEALAWLPGPLLALAVGAAEDVTKRVSVSARLLACLAIGAAMAAGWGVRLPRLDIALADPWLQLAWVAVPLTAMMLAGLGNAFNIIDGYHGLAGVVAAVMFASLGIVALRVGDLAVLQLCLGSIGAIVGFLIWNYPRGHLFLGDGGAYFLGFLAGTLGIVLVARHAQVSAWFPALLFIYPVVETLFSIWRRVVLRKRSASAPDAAHLHHLLYKRMVRWAVGSAAPEHKNQRNALTSPYLWILSSLAATPAVVFWDKPHVLMMFCAVFVVSYLWLYARIVRLRAPRWMMIRRRP
ncbi:MAG: glycosyltransferase [Betaproteobacteria bacterium]|nr:glycosyltransferase [Betaproteobacteria bacterium]